MPVGCSLSTAASTDVHFGRSVRLSEQGFPTYTTVVLPFTSNVGSWMAGTCGRAAAHIQHHDMTTIGQPSSNQVANLIQHHSVTTQLCPSGCSLPLSEYFFG